MRGIVLAGCRGRLPSLLDFPVVPLIVPQRDVSISNSVFESIDTACDNRSWLALPPTRAGDTPPSAPPARSTALTACTLDVTVENGRVVKIDGGDANPVTRGYHLRQGPPFRRARLR